MKWGRRLLLLFLKLPPLVVLIVPPVYFVLFIAFPLLVNYLDRTLAKATPLAAYEASAYLGRTVEIGKLTVSGGIVTSRYVWTLLTNPSAAGTIPIAATDIVLGNKPSEIAYAGGNPVLARAKRVTIYFALADLLKASNPTARPFRRVVVESPELTIVRDPKGNLNILHIVPPQPKPTQPKPPMGTMVEIWDGTVHLRDYAAKLPNTVLPAINSAVVPKATIDMTGRSTLRFAFAGAAQPGTSTEERLGGIVRVTGQMTRGEPGEYEGAPSRQTPRYMVRIEAADGDAPYWYYYFLAPVNGFRVMSGRGDATIVLAAPPLLPFTAPDAEKKKPVPIDIHAAVRFREGVVRTSLTREPFTNADGSLEYEDGNLLFNGQARSWGEKFAANGALWGLTAETAGAKATPQFAVHFNAPRAPVAALAHEFGPRKGLPQGLTVGGVARAQGDVAGPLSDPRKIVARATVSGVEVVYAGYPAVHAIAGDVQYADGVAEMTNLRGTLAGGGAVSGKATARLIGEPGGNRQGGDVAFGLKATGVDLADITALHGLTREGDARTRLAGKGDAAVSGTFVGGRLMGVADVVTHNFRIGQTAFPIAQGRVRFDNGSVVLTQGRLESGAGIARVSGNVRNGDALSLDWQVRGLDLATVGQTLGRDGLSGLVSARGNITGTVKAPRVLVRDLLGMNLHYTIPAQGESPAHYFAADTVTGSDIILTRNTLTLSKPLRINRYPAVIAVAGTVTDLTPADPKAKFDPKADLTATVQNLEYREVESQIGRQKAAAETASALAAAAGNPPGGAGTIPTEEPPTISASLTRGAAHITGRLSNPTVTGSGTFEDSLLLGPYPVEKAYVQFRYSDKTTRITDASLLVRTETDANGQPQTAAVKGNLTIAPDGALQGAFRTGTYRNSAALSDTIDIARFTFLTGGKIRLSGQASAQGTISGTVKEPHVGLTIASPNVQVAGIPFADVKLEAQYKPSTGPRSPAQVEVTALNIAQGAAQISLTQASYNPETGDISLAGNVQVPDISDLVSALRRSDLPTTDVGERIVRGLSQFPENFNGRLTLNNLTVRGRFAKGEFQNPNVAADIRGSKIRIGDFTTDSLVARASLNGKIVRVEGLEAKTAYSTVRGNGIYDPDRQTNAVLESNDFRLESLRALPNLASFPLEGNVGFFVSVTGESRTPQISLSVDGQDILLRTGADLTKAKAITFSGVHILGGVEQDPDDKQGRYQVNFPQITITRGAAELRANVRLPLGEAGDPTIADRPISVQLQVPRLNLADFAELLQSPEDVSGETERTKIAAKGAKRQIGSTPPNSDAPNVTTADQGKASGDIGGALAADVTMAGTLRRPSVKGYIALAGLHFRLPRRPGSDRDRFSPIKNLDSMIRLAGTHVFFDRASYEAAVAKEPSIALTTEPPTLETLLAAEPAPGTGGTGTVATAPTNVPKPTKREASKPTEDTTLLTIGGLNGQKGDFGTVAVTGDIAIENLSNLQEYLMRNRAGRPVRTADIGGAFNVAAAFNRFSFAAENVLANAADPGKGDAFKTRVDGTLNIAGSLTEPTLATPPGAPLRLSGLEFRLPSASTPGSGGTFTPLVNPHFNIAFHIAEKDKAALFNAGFFRFEVQGDATFTGDLFKPEIMADARRAAAANPNAPPRPPRSNTLLDDSQGPGIDPFNFAFVGDLTTVGGFLNFQTSFFKVQRDGDIAVRYGNVTSPGVTISNTNPVIARARIVTDQGAALGSYRTSDIRNPLSGIQSAGGAANPNATQAYEITVTLRGPLDLFSNPNANANAMDPTGAAAITGLPRLEFSSDPPLTQGEIIALVLPEAQFQLATGGRVEDAVRSFTAQALTSSLLPGQVSRITDTIANTLGLQDLSVNYSPDGSLPITLAKRLGPPFDRVVVTVSRTLQTRNQPSQLQPYTFGVSYDVFQLKRQIGGARPRLNVGFNSDDQKVVTYFLRGTIWF